MSREDVSRFIEMEVPDIGLLENDVAQVVCFRSDCEERIEVDPTTLVVEDNGAVETIAEMRDDPMDREGEPGRKRVEVYCSPSCRNTRYGVPNDC